MLFLYRTAHYNGFHTGIHPELMSCMNRVYLRGCEAKYLEQLLGGADFCEKPPETGRRSLGESDEQEVGGVRPKEGKRIDRTKGLNGRGSRIGGGSRRGVAGQGSRPGVTTRSLVDPDVHFGRHGNGDAGSLVIHIRSGDIFSPINAERMKVSFPAYGQVR